MKLTVLLENTSNSPALACKHGLSLYFETPGHRLLFDLGPDGEYLKNAAALGVDISQVDTAIVSHGHYDHGGGLGEFLKANQRARVYLHRQAFEGHYNQVGEEHRYIGLPRELEGDPRLVLTDGNLKIDPELELFSGITEHRYPTRSNQVLKVRHGQDYRQDTFQHEQNLILRRQGKQVLVAGCAHNGIADILRRAEELCGGELDAVISGFHLYNNTKRISEDAETVEAIAGELAARRGTRFYTFHCTGLIPFEVLKKRMGDQIAYLPGGSILEL